MLRIFLKDRRANVAPMFALAMVPVIGFVGAAIDYSRASSTRTALQAALDSTALMLSKEVSGLTATQINQKAIDYVTTLLNRPEAQGLTVTAAYSTQPTTVKVTGSASVKSDFMGLVGVSNIGIGTSSTVTWGSTKLRVALALDNTGSMSSAGKMDALKTATKNLLTQLQGAATTAGDVQVSIVPFSKDVNIGKSNYQATWLDWSDWDAANGSWSYSGGGGFCIGNYCWNGSGWVLKTQSWNPANHNTWNGCVTDRTKSHDVKNTTPTSDKATWFVPEQYSSCTPAAVKTLSHDWSAMKTMVNNMEPAGSTNQTIGLAVAWQTLSQGAPFNAPALPPDTQPVIVLMSDGLNTQNRWDGNGSNQSNAVDDRMKLACANVKAAGIQIYTVQVNTSGDPLSTLLRDCATDNSKFFYLTSALQMVSAFEQIGTSLAKLRISK
jgi:Flp pilus assembly protein TadG